MRGLSLPHSGEGRRPGRGSRDARIGRRPGAWAEDGETIALSACCRRVGVIGADARRSSSIISERERGRQCCWLARSAGAGGDRPTNRRSTPDGRVLPHPMADVAGGPEPHLASPVAPSRSSLNALPAFWICRGSVAGELANLVITTRKRQGRQTDSATIGLAFDATATARPNGAATGSATPGAVGLRPSGAAWSGPPPEGRTNAGLAGAAIELPNNCANTWSPPPSAITGTKPPVICCAAPGRPSAPICRLNAPKPCGPSMTQLTVPPRGIATVLL